MIAAPADTRRLGLAIHEGGHAVAAVLFGVTVNACSIEIGMGSGAGAWKGGVACLSPSTPFKGTKGAPISSSVLLTDWRMRRRLEADLAHTLAGPIAELVYAPIVDHERVETDYADAERIARHRRTLLEPTQALLAETEAARLPRDEETAFEVARLCASGVAFAASYLDWFKAEVFALVRSSEFRRPLQAVTLALLEHGELDGADVHALINGRSRSDTAHTPTTKSQVAACIDATSAAHHSV